MKKKDVEFGVTKDASSKKNWLVAVILYTATCNG